MDGIVLINKEKGISSFGVVAKIRKIFDTKKVGHCGTLDPNATGVLPIMIGNATKISKYLVEHDKEYIATLKLGVKTDSGDEEGNVIETDSFKLKIDDEEFYKEKISEVIGVQEQIPPMYSAVKVKGKKLYEYARQGIELERKARQIEIYSIEIVKINYENNEIKFKVSCSKGTYIRTLCEKIAEMFGSIGYMKELVRTKVDKFKIEDSITISELEELENKEKCVIPINYVFTDFNNIDLNKKQKELLLNGVRLSIEQEDGVYNLLCNEEYLGIGIIKNHLLKRDVIIC